MSNPPPSDAAASQYPGLPHSDADPWNWQGALASLLPPLLLLLNDIMRSCHAACSDSTETANSVTRELHRLLQRLVAAIDGELQSNPCSCLRTFRVCWHLLGRLAEGINRHFQFRPRIMFTGQGADLQSAAAAARGIKDCFTRCIELLSADDDRAGNIASFAIFLDSDRDAEALMRFAFLDLITRRVAAVKRPGRGWNAMVDGETVRLEEGVSASGCNAAIAPVLQFASAAVSAAACGDLEDFDDAKCSICLCASFDSSSDGGVSIDVREMKCPGRHTFHSQCARRWFVDEKHSSCPYCRHDFSGLFCDRIAATLQHQVDATGTGSTVHWNTRSPNQRLAALNVLLLLPRETPLGRIIASALLWSCFDAAAGVANVALRCGRLSLAIEGMLQGEIGLWCSRLVEAFAVAETGATRHNVAMAICDLAQEEDSRACLAAAGACGALVEALKVAEEDNTRDTIAWAMANLALCEEGRTGLAAAGAFCPLVEALKVAEEDCTRNNIAWAMGNLAESEEGRTSLAAAGALCPLVEALKVAEEDNTKGTIAWAMGNLAESEEVRTSLAAAGAFCPLVEALKVTEEDNTRDAIALAIGFLALCEEGRTGLAAAGACGALVEALKVAEEDCTRNNIAWAMCNLAEIEEVRTSLAAAGAFCPLVQALKVAEEDNTRDSIASAIGHLALCKKGRTGLAAAGACGALVEALKVAEEDDARKSIAWAMGNLALCEEVRTSLAAAGAIGALEAAQRMFGCSRSIVDALDSLQPHLRPDKRMKLSHGAS